MSEVWTCLVRIKSAGGLRSHLIDKPSFSLGRSQDADVPLLAQSISRFHLQVEIKNEEIWATDKNSANGTFRNNQPMPTGVAVLIGPHDVLRLGTETEELQFVSIPKPMELRDVEQKRDSLKEAMKDLAKQYETQAKSVVEKELRRARSESEQILAEARKLAEIQKTQENLELQAKRQAQEAAIAKLKEEAQEEISRERLKSKREADVLIAEAQRTIQKDFDEAGKKIEGQMADAHARATAVLQTSETKAQIALNEAREEAKKLRNTAAEEARLFHKEAMKKGEDFFTDIKAKIEKETSETRAQLIEKAREDAERERERIMATAAAATEELDASIARIEKASQEKAKLDAYLEELHAKRRKAEDDLNKLTSENQKLIEELKKVGQLEERRTKAERELEAYMRAKREQEAVIEREFKELREKRLLEFENSKREQDNELAKARVKALDEIREQIEQEEKNFLKTKKLRAVDLSQTINARLIPQVKTWLEDKESASYQLKDAVELAVTDFFVNQASALNSVSVAESTPSATQEERDKTHMKMAYLAAAAVAFICFLFRTEIRSLVERSQKNSYSSKMLEQRRIQSIYHPEQTDEFLNSYTDNILYMKGYYEAKTESRTIENWTLKLNDLGLLRSMGLSEEDIVKFIAKETNLVQRLGVLRDSIDAVYLSEGLDRMRKAEAEDVEEIKTLLKGDANYRRIRGIEKNFIRENLKTQGKAP